MVELGSSDIFELEDYVLVCFVDGVELCDVGVLH